MNLSKKNTVLFLILIGGISLGLKLYPVDFSIPLYSDDLTYILNAIAHTSGDFSQPESKGIGWSLLISPFLLFINSNNFLDYSNFVRILSISISSFTILPVYFVGRKFFNEKYSLVVASLFAFEPHLNYTAGFGLAEPLYHLTIIGSFYFILNKDTRYIWLSLSMAGFLWWVRINGFIMFLIIPVIYFVNYRKCPNLLKNYAIGVMLFLVIVSPMLIQRYDQYGDPLYFWYSGRIFAGDYEKLMSENVSINQSALDYIEKNGISDFSQTFILAGIYNMFSILSRISFPYLFILIPFGLLFSVRAFDQDKKFIKANWILILVSLSLSIITISIIPERRYLFYLFPFLIIFATIPIQRVTEYGLSTFSFSEKKKNAFLVITIFLVIILSSLFTFFQYGKPDLILESEKLEFAKFAVHNLKGKILNDPGHAMDYFYYVQVTEPPGVFKLYKIDKSKESDNILSQKITNLTKIYVYGKTMEQLIDNGEKYGLRYLVSEEKGSAFHTFADDVYGNEIKYPYLKKVFDSTEKGYKKLKIKVFEIDYKKFREEK